MLRPLHCLASLREAGSKFPLTYKGDVSTQIPSPLAIIFELISGRQSNEVGFLGQENCHPDRNRSDSHGEVEGSCVQGRVKTAGWASHAIRGE